MQMRCERRGQCEVGIIAHDDTIYAAFGASVSGHNICAYTRTEGGHITLTRWDGGVMLACRYEIVREFHDGSLALMFRLTNGRFIVGYALGEDGMVYRGELLQGCDDKRANHEALELAGYWSGIDLEDELNPLHGEPDEEQA